MYYRLAKVGSMILVLTMLFTSTGVLAYAQEESHRYKITLELNDTDTETFLKSEMLKKGNKGLLGYEFSNTERSDASLLLQFDLVENGDYGNFVGEAYLKVKNVLKYKFKFNDSIKKITTDKGNVYFGPLIGEAKSDTIANDFVFGLYFNTSTEEIATIVSIGNIDPEKGNAFLIFGDATAGYKDAVNVVLSRQSKPENNDTERAISSSVYNEIFRQNVSKAATDYTLQYTTFSYRTTGKTTQIAPTDGQYRNRLISEATTPMNNQVFGFNIYARDAWLGENGEGMTKVAGWSNTAEVQNYLNNYQDPYNNNDYSASLADMYIGVGNTNLLMNIDTQLTYPQDSSATTLKAFQIPIKHPAIQTTTGTVD